MVKKEKRLQKIRQNPKNVRYDDLVNCLLDYGFTIDGEGTSHRSVRGRAGDEVLTTTIVKPHGGRKQVAITYVKNVLKLIDKVIAAQSQEEEELDNGNED